MALKAASLSMAASISSRRRVGELANWAEVLFAAWTRSSSDAAMWLRRKPVT
ncbi:hypothetical protein D3C87_1978690 [compost metagenome]